MIELNSRVAIVYKDSKRVVLCYYRGHEGMLVISVMFCDYVTYRVSYQGDRWLIEGYHDDKTEAGFMFADYIQKGDN